MKIKNIIALSAVLSVAFFNSAMASDGTISFTGKVVAQTCKVTTGTNGNFTVTLPTVSQTALASANATTGLTPFSINLTGCTAGGSGVPGNVKAFFEPGANTDFNTNKLKNATAGGAQNVQIELLNSDGAATILLGKDASAQDVHAETITNGNATLRYMARYFATNAATPGEVTSSVNYTIAYE
ncbi:TPA: fimbrial protein [Escherichia coli]|nr:fimbrial protein [Escherichia coli]